MLSDMNKYNLIVMSKTSEGVEERIEKLIKALGGKTLKTKALGKKQMAYPIAKQTAAEYLSFEVELPGAAVVQLETKLNVEEQKTDLLRHLLVKAQDSVTKKK